MNVSEMDKNIVLRIRKYCCEIKGFTAGFDYPAFEQVLQMNRATIFTLEQIGECVKKLSEDFRKTYNHIPWQEIMGLRNRIAHDYDGIYLDVVWETATEDIPKLRDDLRLILEELGNGDIDS